MINNLTVIELDRPRTLKFGNKALKKIEKMFNCKITKLNLDNLGVDDIEKLVFAGLEHEDATLTQDLVSDLLDQYCNFGDELKLVTEAFTSAFGAKKEVKQVDEKKDLVETPTMPQMGLDGTPLINPQA